MRRTAYHISIAVLTFMLGVFATLYFYRSASLHTPISVSVPSVSQSSVASVAKAEISLSCNDELLRQIATELLRDEDFVDYLEYQNLETFSCSDNFRIQRVDLNRDRTPEFVVHGLGRNFCSPTGNCSFWVYRRTERGYEPLLETDGVQQFYFQRTFRNGYRDIVTAMHGSAWDSDLSVFRFDGAQYQLVKCMSRSYSYLDRQGRFHETSTPIITLRECQEE